LFSYEEALERIPTHLDKIVQALKDAGPEGVTNAELNKITFKYDARISDLRRKGYVIKTEYIARGVYKYYLISTPSQIKVHDKAIDIFVEEVIKRGGKIDAWAIKPLVRELRLGMKRESGYYENEAL
jgi:hypothetical protein